MSVAVLVPWRDVGCPHRSRALAWVLSRLGEHGYTVVVGRHESGGWCKAAAVADALSQTDADTLIVHDADVWTDGLSEATQRVQEGGAWAVPHRGLHRLTEAATERYVAGETLDGLQLAERAYLGLEGGGVTVVRRDVFEACPIDPRFVGWGGEDESFGFALKCLYGPAWRGKSAMAHLWHPPQRRTTRSFGSLESRELRKRYAKARFDPSAMQSLVKEAHDAQRSSLALDDARAAV